MQDAPQSRVLQRFVVAESFYCFCIEAQQKILEAPKKYSAAWKEVECQPEDSRTKFVYADPKPKENFDFLLAPAKRGVGGQRTHQARGSDENISRASKKGTHWVRFPLIEGEVYFLEDVKSRSCSHLAQPNR